ncbi:MAG: ATP-dependent nuclease, partial [Candidatus Odinarchaeia archaeon]
DLIKVLRKLSKRNQLIYTTHSPFMIDMDELNSVRIVTETSEGTKIPSEAWSTDKEALFPLQAALGYSMSQSLFIGKNNLVVEGITDFWFLSIISNILRDAGRPHIDDSIVISPAGGAQKASLLSAMLAGQKLKVGVLLDADLEGKKVRDDIVKNRILRDNRVIFVNEIYEDKNIEMEIEDMFPEEFYLKYVNKAYEKELNDEILVPPLASKKPRITQRIEDAFQIYNITFHKSRPARLILEDFGHLKLKDLPEELIDNMEKLSTLINKRMKV